MSPVHDDEKIICCDAQAFWVGQSSIEAIADGIPCMEMSYGMFSSRTLLR